MRRHEWEAEGTRRFGPDKMKWRFVCPACGWVASVEDWRKSGAPENAVAFSCVGRWKGYRVRDAFTESGPGPCNYAGGGLFGLNPVTIVEDTADYHVFAFADVPTLEPEAADAGRKAP